MGVEWFAGRLKELREAAGLTQGGLAERAGLSKFGISDLEQGRRSPAWETVLALAAALGVECTAFNVPPVAEAEGRGRGRPKKAEGPAVQPTPADKKPAKSRKARGG